VRNAEKRVKATKWSPLSFQKPDVLTGSDFDSWRAGIPDRPESLENLKVRSVRNARPPRVTAS